MRQTFLQPKHMWPKGQQQSCMSGHVIPPPKLHIGVAQLCFLYGVLIVFVWKKEKKVHFCAWALNIHKDGVVPASEAHSRAVRGGAKKWCSCDAWWEKSGVGIMECGSSLKCAEQFFLNTSIFNLHYVNDYYSPRWERAARVARLRLLLFPTANSSSSLL